MFQIFVRSTAKRGYKTLVLNVHSTDTVKYIKNKICTELNLPIHQIRLSFNSKSLNNDMLTINHYNIVNECSLEVTIRALPRCTPITYELKDMKRQMEKFKRTLTDIRKQYSTICNIYCQPLTQCKSITQLFSTWTKIKQQLNKEFARIEYNENEIIDNTNEAFISIKADILKSNDVRIYRSKRNTPSNMQLIKEYQLKNVNLSQRLNDIEKLEREFCVIVESECVEVSELLTNKLNEILHELEMDCDSWTTNHLIEWLKFIEDGIFSAIVPKCRKFIPYFNSNSNTNNNNSNTRFENESRCHLNRSLFKTLHEFGICGLNIQQINDSFLRFIGYDENDRRLLLKNITCLIAVANGNYNKGRKCLGCMENIINSVLIPCGHQPYCMTCTTVNDVERCPICRSNVERILQTYMAGF